MRRVPLLRGPGADGAVAGRWASTLDEFNAAGVAAAGDRSASELLPIWIARNAANRAGFRAADGSEIDSSIGPYPGRLQAFHAGFEWAIHADDAGVEVDAAEGESRQDWLAAVGWFALTESHSGARVERSGRRYVVSRDGRSGSFTRDEFVAGVSDRGLDALDPDLRTVFGPVP
ncbi:MAG: hypothetical protein OEM97_08740 [Acidimicrobiia bacterium]|nr:hypothetical protein [Acidimicrobiia bacterium]